MVRLGVPLDIVAIKGTVRHNRSQVITSVAQVCHDNFAH